MSALNECGVFFIATGERYVAAAVRAAENIREVAPDLPIALDTDRADLVPQSLFSHIGQIEEGHARSKVDRLIHSPFFRTLYIDTDVRLLEDVSSLFRLLDRFDVALTHAHARNRRQTLQTWKLELPDCFPQMNGGVILYRQTEPVRRFLTDWASAYTEAGFKKDQVSLRELLWRSELALYILPPEYNVRYLRYAYFWGSDEARPRILHLRRYHDAGGKRRQVALARLREAKGDFRAALRALGGAFKQSLFLGGRSGQ